ncbi:uncharacterized protein [Chelonus insularis]|uniref:uncharacterized protein n=1 Tax=Chelonus insularis TaxID=460826 RepID=UPI00158CF7B4|nr:uncharacterized protein LOC118071877 [Chelonus insularis]
MVRIIPVHNFLSQNVGQIEEPTASCTANILDQDMLLLALPSHCVKVYGLAMKQYKLLTIFPTVDLVHQLLHSDKGNYVATLESKTSRDGLTINNFVRVYVNWEMAGNQNQAMRARIAGRVTPSLNRSLKSLEMIELPLNGQPTKIACCQTTGNLLVVLGNEAVIHELKIETQQTSKHTFLDFESRPWSIKFSFVPDQLEFAEEFISIMNRTHFMLFRLTNRFHEDINAISNDNTNISSSRKNSIQNTMKIDSRKNSFSSHINTESKLNEKKLLTGLDFTKPLSNEFSYIDWDQLIFNELEEIQRLKSQHLINSEMNNLNIHLNSIKSDKAEGCRTFHSPILHAPEINATITTRSNEDSWLENYIIQHLMRIKIDVPFESINDQDGNKEYFTCSLLKPSYKRQKLSIANFKKSLLRSTKYNIFNGITCLICTSQEGYLVNFSSSNIKELSFNIENSKIYSFTAPVSHAALENTALHVLTEAGLESYTLRIPQFFSDQSLLNCEHDLNNMPVSLIGLRPFLGVKKLLQASKCLVLLASDEDMWTFYSLYLPNVEDVYQDILNAANNHKNSPSTYKHLLGEANIVLKLAKDSIYYSSDAAFCSNINDMSKCHLDNLYKQSCALLADFYISSESPLDWSLSTYYYNLAGLKTYDVLARKNLHKAQGIIIFLSESLLNLQSGPEADALFQEHNIVEILLTAEKNDLLKLILASPVLREYATDKLIHVLSTWESDDLTCLARVLLFLQADKQQQAEKALEPIKDYFIIKKTIANWSWLFDVVNAKNSHALPTFSDFSSILMKLKIKVFAIVLAQIVYKQAVTLDQMIQIFLAYLPSRVGRDGRVAAAALQLFLETYLQIYYNNKSNDNSVNCAKISKNNENNDDMAINEGFKILVRSYLAKLTQKNNKKTDIIDKMDENDNQKILFGNLRPYFLDHPFFYLKDETKKLCKESEQKIDQENEGVANNIRLEIKKLQALLVSGQLPPECYEEVERFLDTQQIEGSLSFRILCTRDTNKEMQILADECPKILLEFAKDKYTKASEWKYFMQFLLQKMVKNQNNQQIHAIYDELIKDTAIYIAQGTSMRGLQRILPDDSLPALQQYIDISNQVIHADYIKTMIIGTGKHLLCNINF